MLEVLISLMILLGAALMVYNIYGFARFARETKYHKAFAQSSAVLYVPVGLLVFFLLGYLFVGLFGHPDLMTAGILFGGSVFVFIIYRLINNIIHRIIDSEEAEKKLLVIEETNRAKVGFMASVSHEMRTPLNVILGLDALALRGENLAPETRSYLERIGVSANHLLSLIGNVLDMNRISTGELTVKHEEFSMADTMKETCSMAATLCRTRGLRFTPVLPPEDCRFIGDEGLLRQCLFSIIDNAVKYTDPPGEVRLTLTYPAADKDTRLVRFDVSDTGVGISKEFLPRVFEPFTQEDSSFTNRFGGSGLGLAVTKNIVELLGGEISVESEKGVGTTFTVELRLPFAAAPAKPAAPEVPPLETLEGRRVLVVEDMPDNAEIVQDLLELEGVESEHAENGQVGLDMFSASPPFYYDAVLMDLRMPVMDGLEATRRIRALDREDAPIMPILALTANAFESDVRDCMEAGINRHLAKPAGSDELYEALKQEIALCQNRIEKK